MNFITLKLSGKTHSNDLRHQNDRINVGNI